MSNGYGKFSMGGRNSSTMAHRAAWLLFRGLIPDGFQIHHICAVRDCVNPDHLMPVTARENIAERETRRVRKAVCRHGHAMEGDNVAWTTRSSGQVDRYCRECARLTNRVQYAKHAEKRRAYARAHYVPR